VAWPPRGLDGAHGGSPVSTGDAAAEVFDASRASFEDLLGWVEGDQAAALTHAELEEQLDARGRDLLRQLFQAQLDLRAMREHTVEVDDAEGVAHRAVEHGHVRPLATIFGQVRVTRLAYRHRGHANLCPSDGLLNLPAERHSHGLRRLAAVEASRGSFDQASASIRRATAQAVGKRQTESLAARAAVDVEDFYARQPPVRADPGQVLVLSADGKGIVMRPDSLRPATARAAAAATSKLATRLSKGEKRNRKRLAEVGAVYDLTPAPRTAAEVIGQTEPGPPRPKPTNKWLTASVVDDAAEVLTRVFNHAERRDPRHQRTWVALVDGNNHQIGRVHAEATTRGITIAIVVDFVHVLEYLWAAAWCFFGEGDPAAEDWVRGRALSVLDGGAKTVAAGLRRRATAQRLTATKRHKADQAARYLTNKADYLDYPTALAAGWPIATGIIEGACRHLVKDRMDITGARWSSQGAEAVLKLRALQANGDFDTYWRYHLDRERQRLHQSRYLNGRIPTAA
jgi:hypothetical protein